MPASPQLQSLGVQQNAITFTNVTMESDKHICVRETGDQSQLVRGPCRRAALCPARFQQQSAAGWLLRLEAAAPRQQRMHPPTASLRPAPAPPQVIIDTASPSAPEKRPIKADSALMHPSTKVIALKAAVPGVEGDNLQIFNLATKAKLKSVQFPQSVVFWKWVTPSKLGLVTAMAVYHWDVEVRAGGCGGGVLGGGLPMCVAQGSHGSTASTAWHAWGPGKSPPHRMSSAALATGCPRVCLHQHPPAAALPVCACVQGGAADPVKVFDRAANLEATQIISYRVDPTEKWCVLVGIAPGAPERPQLVKGFMQLYSVEQSRSQALEAHAAAFTSLQLGGKAAPVISFAQKTLAPGGGAVVSKLHVIELGLPGQTSLKKSAELFFPPEFADDFPVSMQIRWGQSGGCRPPGT